MKSIEGCEELSQYPVDEWEGHEKFNGFKLHIVYTGYKEG